MEKEMTSFSSFRAMPSQYNHRYTRLRVGGGSYTVLIEGILY